MVHHRNINICKWIPTCHSKPTFALDCIHRFPIVSILLPLADVVMDARTSDVGHVAFPEWKTQVFGLQNSYQVKRGSEKFIFCWNINPRFWFSGLETILGTTLLPLAFWGQYSLVFPVSLWRWVYLVLIMGWLQQWDQKSSDNSCEALWYPGSCSRLRLRHPSLRPWICVPQSHEGQVLGTPIAFTSIFNMSISSIYLAVCRSWGCFSVKHQKCWDAGICVLGL